MRKQKNSGGVLAITIIIWLLAITAITAAGLVFYALIIVPNQQDDPPSVVSISETPIPVTSISEEPVSVSREETIEYINLANTFHPLGKSVNSKKIYNANGTLRNEYTYDEYGRLLYFYSHSSTSLTKTAWSNDLEVISTYTNNKHFGDEYYDKDHNLTLFKNIKNGYSYSYTYDSNGNRLTEDYLTEQGACRHTEYTYDLSGNCIISECSINNEFFSRQEFLYRDSKIASDQYSFLGVDKTIHNTSGKYKYDKDGRLLLFYRIEHKDTGDRLIEWEENSYDSFGRILHHEKSADSSARAYEESYEYSPDGLSADYSFRYYDSSTKLTDFSYESGTGHLEYDQAGNIIERILYYQNGTIHSEKYVNTYDSDYDIVAQIIYINGEISSSEETEYFN